MGYGGVRRRDLEVRLKGDPKVPCSSHQREREGGRVGVGFVVLGRVGIAFVKGEWGRVYVFVVRMMVFVSSLGWGMGIV